ncbi:LacI family DNA-binding transcriptional regulator [Demequina sp.]|uniref:LacI family DNA-binding transcriptional regulator n=1 Tax=Demequina sp. TaxID=2050685 RepID=UPI003D0B4236
MAKIQKVAELAGVSTATVSRTLAGKSSVSPETRARVEAAAKQLGYVVSATASSLASGRTRNVGIVLPQLTGWFYTRVLAGAHAALADAGYDLTVYHLDQSDANGADERRKRLFDEVLRRKRVDAFIAVSLELTADELEELHALNKPLVGVSGQLEGIRTLAIDDAAAMRLATQHVISLGHTVIAHIGGAPELDRDFRIGAVRREAYEATLTDAGLTPDEHLVRTADFTMDGGYQATLQLLGDPSVTPTAIVCASDEMAMGALLAARDLGREVPQDLSIVGIDGHTLGEFWGLTTVAQYPEEQGRLAAEALLAELAGEPVAKEHFSVPFKLVVRRSTRALQQPR